MFWVGGAHFEIWKLLILASNSKIENLQVCELTCRLAGLDLSLNCRYEMLSQKMGGGGSLAPVATPVPMPMLNIHSEEIFRCIADH